MLSVVNTASLYGLEGHSVRVETNISHGLPSWNIVGLGDQTIREAVERIRPAIANSGFDYPRQRITINLSPAGSHKAGSHFDLPVAIGVLTAAGIIPQQALYRYALIGELSLSGQLHRVRGVLPLVMTCLAHGINHIILPEETAREAAMAESAYIYPAADLYSVIRHLRKEKSLPLYKGREDMLVPDRCQNLSYDDVKGQDAVKRSMVICAAGAHGMLMIGSPGSGKSMMARCLPGILPPMTRREEMEATRIYSVAGLLDIDHPIICRRPFRAPHQNVTMAAMLGGGVRPVPGEFSLAHTGVLFMDEFTQFNPHLINALRQPLEEEQITISRKSGTAVFPGKMVFVAAANPCPCGWRGDPVRQCVCTPGQLAAYRNRLSGPILDRIDMKINVPRVDLDAVSTRMNEKKMRALVSHARKIQASRFHDQSYHYNSQIPVRDLDRFCPLQAEAKALLEQAYRQIPLTMRTLHRSIRLARTIADLDGASQIKPVHLAEALQYRKEDHEHR